MNNEVVENEATSKMKNCHQMSNNANSDSKSLNHYSN